MSLGYFGGMKLAQQDETMLIYTYWCSNLNKPNYEVFWQCEDGEIYIPRDALVEPEIHRKLKRMPSGRKRLVEKRVRTYFYDTVNVLIKENKIQVKNASGTWKTNEYGIDIWAMRLIWNLFEQYQDSGEIPEQIWCGC